MDDYRGHHGHDHYDHYDESPYDDDDWYDDNDDYDNVFTIWYFWLVIIIVMCFCITCLRSCYQNRCCKGADTAETRTTATVAYVETTTGGQTFAQEFAPAPNPGTFNHAYVMGPHMFNRNGEEPKPEDLPPSYHDAIGYPAAPPPEVSFPVVSPPGVAASPPPSAPDIENSTTE